MTNAARPPFVIIVTRDGNAEPNFGKLSIYGPSGGALFSCETLEDRDRRLEAGGVKIAADTAIPLGEYEVLITHSQRFGKPLPILIGVKQFVGIRIHPGNDKEDTEGCILVGMARGKSGLVKSRVAFDRLFQIINTAIVAGHPVRIKIERATK